MNNNNFSVNQEPSSKEPCDSNGLIIPILVEPLIDEEEEPELFHRGLPYYLKDFCKVHKEPEITDYSITDIVGSFSKANENLIPDFSLSKHDTEGARVTTKEEDFSINTPLTGDIAPGTFHNGNGIASLSRDPIDKHPITSTNKTPIAIWQELKNRKNTHFKTYKNELYFFDGTIYRLFPKEDALILLTGLCYEEINACGSPTLCEKIYKCAITDPFIVYRDFKPICNVWAFRNAYFYPYEKRWSKPDYNIFITSYFDVDYVESYGVPCCPNFDAFLDEIAVGNSDIKQRIWEMVGYILSTDTHAKSFFLLQGVMDSGKSVLGELILSCINMEAVTSLDMRNFGDRFALADLAEKRLNTALDMPAGYLSSNAVSMLKQLTGGDLISSDVKFKSRTKFHNRCKLLFGSNHPLLTRDPDEAFLTRAVVVPFTHTIPEKSRNPYLRELLKQERLAIILRSIDAYLYLVQNNYRFTGNFPLNAVVADGSSVIIDDAIVEFINNFCDFTCANAEIPTTTLHRVFCTAYPKFACDGNQFSRLLFAYAQRNGIRRIKKRWEPGGSPANGFSGIQIIHQ